MTKLTPNDWADQRGFSYLYVQHLIARGCIVLTDGLIDGEAADQAIQVLSIPQGDETTLSQALHKATAEQIRAIDNFFSNVSKYLGCFNAYERHYFETVVDPGITIILDILREWLDRTATHNEEKENDEDDRTKAINNNSKRQ